MDIIKIATEVFLSHIGNQQDGVTLDPQQVASAFRELLIGADGRLDLNNLLSALNANSLTDTVKSWLGSGENMPISADMLGNVFGDAKISQFAHLLGLDKNLAQQTLAETIPEIVDQASPNGNLLDIAGSLLGSDNLLGSLKKFF